jgi:hypothetical protein
MAHVKEIFISNPTSIKYGFLDRSTQENQTIIDFFKDLRIKKKMIEQKSNGWKSDWFIHEDHPEILDSFMNQIIRFFIDNIGTPRNNLLPERIKENANIDLDANVWFQGYDQGDSSPIHNHSEFSRYSFSYYLNEVIDDPLILIETKLVDGNIITGDETSINIKQDMIVFFPSYVLHKVNPVKSKRFVIAGNINDIAYKI